ncbi:regulator of g protein signaling-related [Anaeramoeba flamelloides]|uniref:Regulator of g protein signaling-related n=1 Tax=Anaeramoeba flamelloides TaxID=1746091 RepID=A0ABQ8Y9H5_9EUKA|nr:regulator of g protein signaling-related [Anaeramoeba flamelloides]
MLTGQKITSLGLNFSSSVPLFSHGSGSPNKMEECTPQKILRPIKDNKIFYQNENIFFEKFNTNKRKSNEFSPRKRQLVSGDVSDEENNPDWKNIVSPNKLRRTSINKRNNSKKRKALRKRHRILQDNNRKKNSKQEFEKYAQQMNLSSKFEKKERRGKKKRKSKKKKKSKTDQLIFELQQPEVYEEEDNKDEEITEETEQGKENSSHSMKRILGRIRTINNSNNLLSSFKKKKHRKIHRKKQKKTKKRIKRRYFKTFDKKNIKPKQSKNLKAQKKKKEAYNLQTVKDIKIPKTRIEKEKIQKEISKYFPTFTYLLRSKRGLYYFHKFLKSQYCSENLDFYQAVNRYKRIKDPKKRSRNALKIFNTFVKTSSKHEINIQYENRFEIQENIKKEHFPPSLYNSAQEQIYHLMSNDSFMHFFNHPISIYMLSELKSHN